MTVSPERIEESLAELRRWTLPNYLGAALDDVEAALREAQAENTRLREDADDLAEFVMRTLETERQQTGVDEWDESDERTMLYNAAHGVIGDQRYGEICAEVHTALAPADEAKR